MSWLLTGTVGHAAARQAIAKIVCRHTVLHSHLAARGGRIVQISDEFPGTSLEIIDVRDLRPRDRWRAVAAWTAQALREPRTLTAGTLFERRLWRLGGKHWVLALVAAHSVWDAGSTEVFIREFIRVHDAWAHGEAGQPVGRPLHLPAHADPQRAEGDVFDLWRQRLARERRRSAFPELLAIANRRPFQMASAPIPPLSPALRQRLADVAHECAVSSAASAMAGVALLLDLFAGPHPKMIGVAYANRDRPEHRELLGCLVEIVPVVVDVSESATLRDVVRAAGRALQDFRRAGVTMGALFPESAAEGPWRGEATCEVLLNYMAAGDASFHHAGETLDARFCGYSSHQPKPIPFMWEFALFDFTLRGARDGGLEGDLNYNTAAVEREYVHRLSLAFARILRTIALHPDQGVRGLLHCLATSERA